MKNKMNKKLTALEKLMNGCCNTCTSDICETKRNGACPNFKNYKIVETSLKRISELEKENLDLKLERDNFEFKVLEIIRKKLLYIDFKLLLASSDYEIYCFMVGNKELSKEEYDLLKEGLKSL